MTDNSTLEDVLKPEEPINSNPIVEIQALYKKSDTATNKGCLAFFAACVSAISSAYTLPDCRHLLKEDVNVSTILKTIAGLMPFYLAYRLIKTGNNQFKMSDQYKKQAEKKLEDLHEDYENN